MTWNRIGSRCRRKKERKADDIRRMGLAAFQVNIRVVAGQSY